MKRLATAFATAALAINIAHAQYPTKPVRMIVPYPPGGTVDVVGRVLAQRLTEQMGQQVVVENRSGANGTIGSDFVAKSVPDGYTVLMQAPIFVINPLFLKNVPYDVQRDFFPFSTARCSTPIASCISTATEAASRGT